MPTLDIRQHFSSFRICQDESLINFDHEIFVGGFVTKSIYLDTSGVRWAMYVCTYGRVYFTILSRNLAYNSFPFVSFLSRSLYLGSIGRYVNCIYFSFYFIFCFLQSLSRFLRGRFFVMNTSMRYLVGYINVRCTRLSLFHLFSFEHIQQPLATARAAYLATTDKCLRRCSYFVALHFVILCTRTILYLRIVRLGTCNDIHVCFLGVS